MGCTLRKGTGGYDLCLLEQYPDVRLGQGLGHFGEDDGKGHRGEAGEGRAGERIDALDIEPGDDGVQQAGCKPGRVNQLGVQDQKADKAADRLSVYRFIWQLSTMPYAHYPDCVLFWTVEKTIRSNKDFSVG